MKTFQIRTLLKEKIHNHFQEKSYLERFYVNQREIWYCHLGANIGYEEDWKWSEYRRPVLVLKKIGILYRVAPLTSKPKENNKFYHIINSWSLEYFEEAASKVTQSWAILSQVRVLDKTRFIHKIVHINNEEFLHIKKKLKTLLF